MRIGEQRAALGEPVDVWRLYPGIAAQTADPVVHVIDADEDHVRLDGLGRRKRGSGGREKELTPIHPITSAVVVRRPPPAVKAKRNDEAFRESSSRMASVTIEIGLPSFKRPSTQCLTQISVTTP